MNSKGLITYDVIVLGAGAAGMMCAIEAGKRGRSVLMIERNAKAGEKIRISGGGRCNFTNLHTRADAFISENPHFCKSALARYTPHDFIELVEKHGIAYHEKKLGQLFCDGSAQAIIDMLRSECEQARVSIRLGCEVQRVAKSDRFQVKTSDGLFESQSLVVATGGLSVPQLGATNLGYEIARSFGLKVTKLRPGLVPLTVGEDDLELCRDLSGVSLDAVVGIDGTQFHENLLFTHRGVSGPAILQISSYWREGEPITINLLPRSEIMKEFETQASGDMSFGTRLGCLLPNRFVKRWCHPALASKPLKKCSPKEIRDEVDRLQHWQLKPKGTEGFGKAEVTVGGVDTDELSSKTMESNDVPGLYIIGEVVDVTGWLGGYNFQWAWSSGWVAGQFA
jgi:predicted Rossmann fold flavoprotein